MHTQVVKTYAYELTFGIFPYCRVKGSTHRLSCPAISFLDSYAPVLTQKRNMHLIISKKILKYVGENIARSNS